MNIKCSSCHKKFNYEKTYGICPRCGVYNRKVSEPYDHAAREDLSAPVVRKKERSAEGKDRMPVFTVVMVVITILCVVSSVAGILMMNIKDAMVPGTEEVEFVSAFVGEVLTYGDYTYEVTDAVFVEEEGGGNRLPEDSKLLAVYLSIQYTGKEKEYKNRFLPYIYDGKGYMEPTEETECKEYAEECGLRGDCMSAYSVYSSHMEVETDAYLLYLVDRDCGEVSVNLEGRKNTYLERVYEVWITPREWEQEAVQKEDGLGYDQDHLDGEGF